MPSLFYLMLDHQQILGCVY